jgi:aminodeoxyfutalosine synthase
MYTLVALDTYHSIKDKFIEKIVQKVYASQRITTEDALYLYNNASVSLLGVLANFVRYKFNKNNVYFNRNFHIEPTNLCVFDCKFCSYSRTLKDTEEGWFMSIEQIEHLVKKYDGEAITEVHVVGGVHPKLTMDATCNILKTIKTIRPDLHIKAFTAVELDYIIKKAKMSYTDGLQQLKDAGLDSIPGGGAEIFDETIRQQICADKASSYEWLAIHKAAHEIGIHSNATMLYGHIENYEHRVDHMNQLRILQDTTHGFNTFIPLKFRNQGNEMSGIKEVSIIEDLRNYAVSRIFLDNFNHIKAYWPMIGRNTAQLSLSFGVDDLDGTIDDSTKIYTMAGSEEQNPTLTTQELVAMIKQVNRTPIERDTLYNVVKKYD